MVVAILAGLASAAAPSVAGPALAASEPKVAVIVGPSGSRTAKYRDLANSAVATARRYTSNVVRVYSPNATWRRVRSAMTGASVVIYFGRGRGYPSRYSSHLDRRTEDGLGLNPVAGGGNSRTRWFGEAYIRRVALAPSAVVLIYRAAYAPGTGEAGAPQPSLSVAHKRVDNYGAGFLDAGAAAIIAERSGGIGYYLRTILTGSVTLGSMWRASPTANGHVRGFTSRRTPGARGQTDPERTRSRYYRSIVGYLGVTTNAVRAASPPPQPTSTLYGSGINADSLNNSQVGGPNNRRVSYRFRATTSSALTSVRIYLVSGSGYSGGTGGTLEVSVQEDDGTASHFPSGSSLTSITIQPGNPISIGPLPLITFPAPANLVAGHLYHVVFRNVDPSPTDNYVSVDGLYTFGTLTTWQPRFSNTDWANLVWSGGAWSADRGAGQGVITPIMALNYANGQVAGVGYMEVWVGLPKTISGSKAVREKFTVSGADRRVSSVSVRLKRVSGSSPLQVRLETSSGTLIEKGTIAASSIPTTGHASWATYRFAASHTLQAGHGYRLLLTSAADTSYSIFVIREGSSYGFSPSTYFADGSGQYNSGSGWVGFDQPGGASNMTQGDLQFYFR